MKPQSKLVAIMGIIGLSITFMSVLFPAAWLQWGFLQDAHWRHGHMYVPSGSARPNFWQCAWHAVQEYKITLLILVFLFSYSAHLFMLMVHWLRGKPRLHRLRSQVIYAIVSALISLALIFFAINDSATSYHRALVFLSAVTYLFIPIWLPQQVVKKEAAPA